MLGREESADPDITVWKIDANEVVNHGTEEFSWKEFLNDWTFILPGEDIGLYSKYWNDDMVSVDLSEKAEGEDQSFADKVQSQIHYIVKVNSVKDTDGNELDASLLEISGADEHKGFQTAFENGILKLKAGNDTYELQRVWNGEGDEHDGWGDIEELGSGSFDYKVKTGGGILLNAILKKIVKPEEPTPEEPTPEKPTPEEPAPEEPAEEPAVLHYYVPNGSGTGEGKATWADQVRASEKNSGLIFDGRGIDRLVTEVCGDFAQAMDERPDVSATIIFMDQGRAVSITIPAGSEMLEKIGPGEELFTVVAEKLELSPVPFLF